MKYITGTNGIPRSIMGHIGQVLLGYYFLNLDEIVIFREKAEREEAEHFAALYSILLVLDNIEKAYTRDQISEKFYTTNCFRLLAQYEASISTPIFTSSFTSIERFIAKFDIYLPSAIHRIEEKIPSTLKFKIDGIQNSRQGFHADLGFFRDQQIPDSTAYENNKNMMRLVADATQNFITFLDALKLNYRAKDQLHPLLAELMQSINKVSTKDFLGKSDMINWLVHINKLQGASEEISDDDARELQFNIERAYSEFYDSLNA